jgi:hypothetical protein
VNYSFRFFIILVVISGLTCCVLTDETFQIEFASTLGATYLAVGTSSTNIVCGGVADPWNDVTANVGTGTPFTFEKDKKYYIERSLAGYLFGEVH